jgi:PAS domain S-box-containing protein
MPPEIPHEKIPHETLQLAEYERLLSATARRIHYSLDLQTTLNTAVLEVRNALRADRTLIFRFKPDWTGIVQVESLISPQWPSTLGLKIRDPHLQTHFLHHYQQGQNTIINDLNNTPEGTYPLELLTHFQARSALIIPIVQTETLWGLFIVHQCSHPRQWQPLEISFLTQLVTQLAIAIQQSELYTQLQKELKERQRIEAVLQAAKDDLEERVAERTGALRFLNEQLQKELKERRQTEIALLISQERNELILNSMGEGLFGLNLQGEITFANQAAAKLLGYPVQELIGQSIHHFISDPNTSIASPMLAASEATPPISAPTSEISLRHRDGTTFPAEYLNTPLKEHSHLVGTVITFKDISHRHLIEQMKHEFISMVSHELRTPLTSIHGSLRLLASGLLQNQPQKSQHLIEIAAQSTDRLVRLINDILDIERIDSGKFNINKVICNLQDLIQQAINTMQAMADKAQIQIQINTTPIPIHADPDRILQTLTNLLSNAIKFSPPQTTILITTEPYTPTPRLSEAEAYILISVADQGRGIPANKLSSIFERFQQADSSDARNHEGTGLGLAICRYIIEAHQGQIWVKSQPNQGSTFYFTLPL